MTTAIHQPQYIPWVPYFSKILKSDNFVLLNDVQFQKNGLQNRNYILSKSGELRLTIPVAVKLGDKINSVKIADNKILLKHWQSIENCYIKSPYFFEVSEWLKKIYFSDYIFLEALSNDITIAILDYLNINTPILYSSEIIKTGEKSDLILSICKSLNTTKYISGVGGEDYLKISDFNQSKIEIEFSKNEFKPYTQINANDFISKLSILDLLFNQGRESINYII